MYVYQEVDDYLVALKELSPNDPFHDYKKADFEYQIELFLARCRMENNIVSTMWVANMRVSSL